MGWVSQGWTPAGGSGTPLCRPSRRCSNSQQPRLSDPSRCRRSHSCSRRPSRGHLSCLQTQPAKRRLSVWRIHPCHKPTTWREVKCCRWLMAAAVGKGSAPQVHGRAHPRGRRTEAISSTFISKVGTVKRYLGFDPGLHDARRQRRNPLRRPFGRVRRGVPRGHIPRGITLTVTFSATTDKRVGQFQRVTGSKKI